MHGPLLLKTLFFSGSLPLCQYFRPGQHAFVVTGCGHMMSGFGFMTFLGTMSFADIMYLYVFRAWLDCVTAMATSQIPMVCSIRISYRRRGW